MIRKMMHLRRGREDLKDDLVRVARKERDLCDTHGAMGWDVR